MISLASFYNKINLSFALLSSFLAIAKSIFNCLFFFHASTKSWSCSTFSCMCCKSKSWFFLIFFFSEISSSFVMSIDFASSLINWLNCFSFSLTFFNYSAISSFSFLSSTKEELSFSKFLFYWSTCLSKAVKTVFYYWIFSWVSFFVRDSLRTHLAAKFSDSMRLVTDLCNSFSAYSLSSWAFSADLIAFSICYFTWINYF